MFYKILEACREGDCPICRVEQNNVERYIENQFYENVNSPKWRDKLRDSLGFCREHAWLAVDRRLGDSLGFSILYRDVLHNAVRQLEAGGGAAPSSRHWTTVLRRLPEQTRTAVERALLSLTPRKRCPVCEHRDETTRELLSVLVDQLKNKELLDALRSSDGLCFPHLLQALEQVKDTTTCEQLLALEREKMSGLRDELDEFIRKNDYQNFQEGFGREGDAWLRSVALVVGKRKS